MEMEQGEVNENNLCVKTNDLPDLLSQLKHLEQEFSQADGLEDVPEDKANEIKDMFSTLSQKLEILNMLQGVSSNNASSAKNFLEKELSEKYRLPNVDTSENDPEATTILGLSNLDIQGGREIKRKPCEKCKFTSTEKLFSVPGPKLVIDTSHLKKYLDLLALKLKLHKEKNITLKVMEQYKKALVNSIELEEKNGEAVVQNADLVVEKGEGLSVDVEIEKCKCLLDYFSEDEGVKTASRKVVDVSDKELQFLQIKKQDLQKQLDAYNSLRGTEFDNIVREYKEVTVSIARRKWALEELMKEKCREEDDSQ